eukprot:2776987-Prymnesium_polylepis.1
MWALLKPSCPMVGDSHRWRVVNLGCAAVLPRGCSMLHTVLTLARQNVSAKPRGSAGIVRPHRGHQLDGSPKATCSSCAGRVLGQGAGL